MQYYCLIKDQLFMFNVHLEVLVENNFFYKYFFSLLETRNGHFACIRNGRSSIVLSLLTLFVHLFPPCIRGDRPLGK